MELKFSEKFLARIKDENIENLIHKYIHTFKDEISGNKQQILDINTHRNVLEEKDFYYER